MSERDQSRRSSVFFGLATFVLVVAILRIAQEVIVPIALAVLLVFLLSPLVVRLTRWGIPKVVSILLTVTLAFGIISALGWLVTSQVFDLAGELPKYEQNIRNKIGDLKHPQSPSAIGRTAEMVDKIRKEIEEPAAADVLNPVVNRAAESRPIPVEVRPREPSPVELAQRLLTPVLGPLSVAAIVVVFVVAMLFQREDLSDRFIQIVSAGRLNVATQALDDAARRVSRYLLMQLVVNASYGVPIGIGLYFIGIPNALLWGLLATLLRFIPFLGPWIAACFPVVLSIAVDPGWHMLIYTVALFVVMEVFSNNVIEVWLYGASTGISNLALLVAAVFWTWLWGSAGLFLSTPLTVCLMVLGRYVPGLRLFSTLLGSQPVLEPPAQFYQRMLSMDAEETLDLAEKYIKERSLPAFYDEVFIPALIMAEEDRHKGTLAEVRQRFIFENSRELIDELERQGREETLPSGAATPAPGEAPSTPPVIPIQSTEAGPIILGVPAVDDADEIVALMLRHLLEQRGWKTEIRSVTAPIKDYAERIERNGFAAVFVSAVPPAALSAARQMCRRIREQAPHIPLIVGIWSREAKVADLKLRLAHPSPTEVVIRLADAVAEIEKLLQAGLPPDEAKAPATGEQTSQPVPSAVLERTATDPTPAAPPANLHEVEADELIDTVRRELATLFDVPISLISIADPDQKFWKAHVGVSPETTAGTNKTPSEARFDFVRTTGEALIIDDVLEERRFANNPFFLERGVRFYAGVPLRSSEGQIVGTLCVIDTKPRQISEGEKSLLNLRATELIEVAEQHHAGST